MKCRFGGWSRTIRAFGRCLRRNDGSVMKESKERGDKEGVRTCQMTVRRMRSGA